MSLKINVNGSWKESKKVFVNVNGSWKESKKVFVNVNGSWKDGKLKNYEWSEMKIMPKCSFNAKAGLLDGNIYVAGGRDETGEDIKNTYEYNISSNTWSEKKMCPYKKVFSSGGMMDSNLIIAQGSADYNYAVKYKPKENTWYTISNPWYNAVLPFNCITDDTKNMYVAGGDDSGTLLSDCYKITSTLSSTKLSSIPLERSTGASIYHNNKIYCVGGFTKNSSHTKDVQIYDVKNNSWSKGTDCPIVVAGYPYWKSKDGNMCILKEKLYKYILDKNTWEIIDVNPPFVPQRSCAIINGNDIYFVATGNGVEYKATNKILKFKGGYLL